MLLRLAFKIIIGIAIPIVVILAIVTVLGFVMGSPSFFGADALR